VSAASHESLAVAVATDDPKDVVAVATDDPKDVGGDPAAAARARGSSAARPSPSRASGAFSSAGVGGGNSTGFSPARAARTRGAAAGGVLAALWPLGGAATVAGFERAAAPRRSRAPSARRGPCSPPSEAAGPARRRSFCSSPRCSTGPARDARAAPARRRARSRRRLLRREDLGPLELRRRGPARRAARRGRRRDRRRARPATRARPRLGAERDPDGDWVGAKIWGDSSFGGCVAPAADAAVDGFAPTERVAARDAAGRPPRGPRPPGRVLRVMSCLVIATRTRVYISSFWMRVMAAMRRSRLSLAISP